MKNRPIVVREDGDLNAKNAELIFRHYDDSLRELERRKLSVINLLDSSASLDDVIEKVNEIIRGLNSIFSG